MSRTGNSWDNGAAKSFLATLKTELIRRKSWTGLVDLRRTLFDYIEVFYNRQRIHSALGYRPPAKLQSTNNATNAATCR